MSEDQAPYGRTIRTKESVKKPSRSPKKPMVISDKEKGYLKQISEKATNMRIAKKMSYEQFALLSGINRNSYFRFDKSAVTGDNYTVALLLKVIAGLKTTLPEFFKDIQ